MAGVRRPHTKSNASRDSGHARTFPFVEPCSSAKRLPYAGQPNFPEEIFNGTLKTFFNATFHQP